MQKLLTRAQASESENIELKKKFIKVQKESQIQTEELKKEKKKIEKEKEKQKEEEIKRKEAETQKLQLQGEVQRLTRENEKYKYEVARIKQKFGEENVEYEIKQIENKEKDKDEKIQQLEESIKLKEESNKVKDEEMRRKDEELQRLKRNAEEAEQKIHRLEQEKEQEKQMKEKKEAELKKLNEKSIIAFINQDPTDFELSDVDVNMKRLTKKQTKHSTISLNQVLENGIWSLEAQFENSSSNPGALGIVRDTYTIPAGDVNPAQNPHAQHIAFYEGYCWYGGCVYCKGSRNDGNAMFNGNQIVRLEYDSNKGTLIFFLEDKQQPVFISGIKEKVRFIIFMYRAGSYCQIRSLKKLSAPTSGHVANEKVVQW
ncbi:MAG: hypothetical protein EZS28_034210 [Streblomastix strix]|uniref:SPRY domain-containing protein n=1 Tax=Streblomastix strix TaxID=222440 RepID=A0A5J4UJ73_9EUKA|nr:MAG: hypothetical protein EZS28_034210 [Streblomastix strix]